MILDETNFEAIIEVGPLMGFELDAYLEWAKENGTVIDFYFGRLYFKEQGLAVLFRLKFGL